MKVLHDWDGSVYIPFKRIIQLILYSLSFIIIPLRKLKIVKEYLDEQRKYVDTIIKLDRLVNVTPILAVKDSLFERYPRLCKKLREKYGEIDIRIHIHIGKCYRDPNRIRLWIPDLEQSENTWKYDYKYAIEKKLILLKDNELPIWHIDNPSYLYRYIDWLYEVLIEGIQIYE